MTAARPLELRLDVPGLHLTGAAYRGAGVAGCVAQAEETAARALAGLAVLTQAQMSHR